jgi:cytochrome c peroxidase
MKQRIAVMVLILFTTAAIFEGCKKNEPDDIIDENPVFNNGPYLLEYGSLPEPQIPSDNLLTIAGVELGRMLFYEKKLSADNTMSCATCHNQETAFADINTFSIGVQGLPGTRNSMAVFNMAWNMNEFFWDGRAHLLRHQSLMPIEDELEMNETLPNVVSKLQATPIYPAQFKKAFGSVEINPELISKALEQFMNSIVSYNSKFDDYEAGLVTLTEQEERGRFLFFTEFNPAFPDASGADCQHCHGGANFENDNYMNNGLDTDVQFVDFGRENVTNNPADRAKFKVTSLRNIELTPPYMHDGRFNTLEEVVDHYNLVKNSSTLDGSFQQQLPAGLQLSQEDKTALVAFLKTLTDYQLISDPRFSDPF